MKSDMRNRTNRFLIISFVVMFILCGCIFVVLMRYIMNFSKNTVTEINDFYLDGMSTQITQHFDTTVEIKLAQVESIVKTVPPQGEVQGEELIETMAISGAARDFRFFGPVVGNGQCAADFGRGSGNSG